MSGQFANEPMLDMYIFETSQMIEQLEQSILNSEKEGVFTPEAINEIFRIMHTVKGSSAIMMFQNISTLAHKMEDIFYFIREKNPEHLNYSLLSDFVLDGIDFIKIEIEKIKNGDAPDGDASSMIEELKGFLSDLKRENGFDEETKPEKKSQSKDQKYYISQDKVTVKDYKHSYKAVIFFEEGCEMENIRAYTIVHNLKDITEEFFYFPVDIIDNEETIETIQQSGFTIYLKSNHTYGEMEEFFQQTIFLESLQLSRLTDEHEYDREKSAKPLENQLVVKENPVKTPEIIKANDTNNAYKENDKNHHSNIQSIISVSVAKLDKLMDLVGEMVIAEAMVTQNPELLGLELHNFHKSAQQLNKITSELQDIVMSIRMVPLAPTFQKMNRIVRDMSKQLNKEVELNIVGEETEVDINIIERISDPLMHLVRNSLDHGIESVEDRIHSGKNKLGTLTLEAKNSGSDVLIIVKDDGKGLNKDTIIKKAMEHNLLTKKPEEMTEREIFNLILLPGFSTKDNVSEYSGRGVGMDVVSKNIEAIGGTLSVDSVPYVGTTITLSIPLTLAIIDGMNLKVGKSYYTIPTASIKESLRPLRHNLITDPDGNEMLLIRGQCFPILRLHKKFNIETSVSNLTEGIIIVVEQDGHSVCVFADELVGQQQVVVKVLPKYLLDNYKIKGLAGCTLLGDGSISLILDVLGLIHM